MTDLPEGGPERRAALTREVAERTGIDEAMIERLLRGFYGRVPVERAHFLRWLALFEKTARERCPPVAADHFIERARSIAESLRQGLSLHQGRPI